MLDEPLYLNDLNSLEKTQGDGCGTGEFRRSGNFWSNACGDSQTQMVFMGIDPYLCPGVGNNAAVYTIIQNDRHAIFDLAHLALYCGDADGMCKVSRMRQQLSYAQLDSLFLKKMQPLWTSFQGNKE
jgi:hypothetical protein